jgi:RNA recognition motif-containing protein
MNIYVGNLPYSIDEDKLKKVFEPFGEVKTAKVITDKFSGSSKGFGFIEMTDREAGLRAIEELNGKEVDGRRLKVNEAHSQQPKEGGPRRPRSGGMGMGGGRPQRHNRF